MEDLSASFGKIMRIWFKDQERKFKVEAESWDSFIDKICEAYGMKDCIDSEGSPWFTSKVPLSCQWFIKVKNHSAERVYFKGQLGRALIMLKDQLAALLW